MKKLFFVLVFLALVALTSCGKWGFLSNPTQWGEREEEWLLAKNLAGDFDPEKAVLFVRTVKNWAKSPRPFHMGIIEERLVLKFPRAPYGREDSPSLKLQDVNQLSSCCFSASLLDGRTMLAACNLKQLELDSGQYYFRILKEGLPLDLTPYLCSGLVREHKGEKVVAIEVLEGGEIRPLGQ